ncbi:MAG TPA: PHP domain-containing protein [Vicinamibacteria bacterium]|nr:PHP domain-containing protein [Vicinamibacteria bacterium]
MLDRFSVARALREIASLMQVEGANPFKVRAYERGARALEGMPEDLGTLVREGRLTSVPGIGSALAATITELFQTGRSPQLDRLREKLPPGVIELGQVLSVSKIGALHRALGISSLADLEAAARAGRLRDVKGFGVKTEQKILADIEALHTRGTETLLHEATREGEALLAHLRASPAVARAEIAGALRRRRETIDRLVAVAAAEKGKTEDALDHAARYPASVTVLERDAARIVMRLPDGLNAEVHVPPPPRFATAWHRLTGSEGHLAKLAVVAEARGLQMDEDGLTRGGRRVSVKDEADIYRELELPFIEPELREDEGEVEAAVTGTLPTDLLRVEDVQGLVHCHTHYSDGKNSVEEMARGADALGMKYMTITDHSPTAFYANGLPLDRLKRQWEDIAKAQEKVKVRLLRGTESDILADGSLDYPDEVLGQLDVIVASVHNRHKMDADQMTRRIVAAMRRPQFKIWGHALGRYVLTRPPFAVHMEKILDAVAESRAAIEINGDPHRLDMEPRWVRMARTRSIPFVISTDAHSVNALRNVRWGVDMARRGWLTKAEVLNTRGVDEFRQAVRP